MNNRAIAINNIASLQICLLCDSDNEVINRGLIIDILGEVQKVASVTYVIDGVLRQTFSILRYETSTGVWNEADFSLRNTVNANPGHSYPIVMRNGDLLLISAIMTSMLLISFSEAKILEILEMTIEKKPIIAVQCGSEVYLFSTNDHTVSTFDTITREFTCWKKIFNMPRLDFSSMPCQYSGIVADPSTMCIFFILYDNDDERGFAFKYCCSTGISTSIADPPNSLCGRWACCLMDDGNIILTGGMKSVSHDASSDSYVFYTGKNTWQQIASMIRPRSHHAIVNQNNGYLMAIGGYASSVRPLNSYEVYRNKTEKWTLFPRMLLEQPIDILAVTFNY